MNGRSPFKAILSRLRKNAMDPANKIQEEMSSSEKTHSDRKSTREVIFFVDMLKR